MRVLKSKSLNNLVLAVLLSLPFVAIASRCIYVQSNKNAYQSYSDEIVETTTLLNTSNVDSYYVNNQLITTYYDSTITYNNQSGIFGFSQIILDLNTLLNTTNVNYVGFRFYTSGTNLMLFYDSNGTEYTLQNANNTIGTFSYVVDMTTYTTKNIYLYRNANVNIYKVDKLDNVFEYSVSKFIQDNDFGNMDLTSWFTGMFLSNTSHNNLYVGFANWYLNYAMLITMVHFLFLILMWFINFCRRLIDRSVTYDW